MHPNFAKYFEGENISEESLVYLLTMSFFLLMSLLFFYSASQITDMRTKIVPLGITIIIIPIILLDILEKSRVFGSGNLAPSKNDSLEDEHQVSNRTNMSITNLNNEFIWCGLFTASIYYIGFFTSIIIYTFLYIFVKEKERSVVMRVGFASLGASITTVLIYFIYVHLLGVVSVFRLGSFI